MVAAVLMGLLGFVFVLIGGFLVALSAQDPRPTLPAIYSLALLTPGVAYFVLAFYVRQRKRWAAVAGLVLACAQMLTAIAALVVFLVYLTLGALEIVLLALWMMGVAVLITSLARLLRGLPGDRRGFEPVRVREVPGEAQDT